MTLDMSTEMHIVKRLEPCKPGEIRMLEVAKRLGVSHQLLASESMKRLLAPRICYVETYYYDESKVEEYRQSRARPEGMLTTTEVARILGCTPSLVANNLHRYLHPEVWGGQSTRYYDPGRVQRLKEIRDQAHAEGIRKIPVSCYAGLLVAPTTAPSSEGMAPTQRDDRVRGTRPVQRIKASGDKASRVSEATERERAKQVNRIDRKAGKR